MLQVFGGVVEAFSPKSRGRLILGVGLPTLDGLGVSGGADAVQIFTAPSCVAEANI